MQRIIKMSKEELEEHMVELVMQILDVQGDQYPSAGFKDWKRLSELQHEYDLTKIIYSKK